MKNIVISFGRNINSVIEVRVNGVAVGYISKREWDNESCWVYEDYSEDYCDHIWSAPSLSRLKQIISRELK